MRSNSLPLQLALAMHLRKKNLSKSQKDNSQWIFFIILLALVFFHPPQAFTAGIDLPRDAEGWTIFTPSADSRVMYVAQDGNDGSGVVYTKANHPNWSTPFTPGTIQAFATSGAAYAQVREGYPDWVLFKRGETFVLSQGTYACIYPKGGRSATEPALIGSYGTSGAAPVLKAGNKTVFWDINGLRWLAVSGLDFYAQRRDPASPEFVDHTVTGEGGGSGFFLLAGSLDGLTGLLFEGCKFRHFKAGGHYSCGTSGGAYCNGIEHFRCVYYDQHSGPGTGHSAGMGGTGASITIRESIFDHNGWLHQAGTTGDETEATMFSHNMYFSNMHNTTMEGTISSRSSSIGLKVTASYGPASINSLLISNNLFQDDEVGVDIDNNYTELYRVLNIDIQDNAFIDLGLSRPTNRTLGWGVNGNGWDASTVTGNYFLANNSPQVTNGFAINMTKQMRDVEISGNVIWGQQFADGLVIQGTGGELSSGMSFVNNVVQIPVNSYYTIRAAIAPNGWAFSGNKYFSNKTDGQQFQYAGVNKTFVDWKTLSGDTSNWGQVPYPDPNRTIAGYMASIGETPTLEAFYAKCRAQDRYNWDYRFTAAAVNAYLKGGFSELLEAAPPITAPPTETPRNFILIQ